jgi:hypothetical protein
MPKVITNKPYSCPYCSNSYASENSVYGHVRTGHPGLRYTRKTQTGNVPQTQETLKAQQLIDLKEKFMNDEITSESYQKILRSIEKKYKVPVQYVDLDVGKLLAGDNNYTTTYLKGHPYLRSIIKLAQSCDYAALFSAIFDHQIRISDTYTGKEITYMDNGELVTKECDLSLMILLYKTIVNDLARIILPQILVSVDDLEEDASLQHSHEAQRSFNDVLASIGCDRTLTIESALIPALDMFRETIVLAPE